MRLAVLPFMLTVAVFGFLVTPAGRADTPSDEAVNKAAATLYEGLQTHQLDNGLRVYLKPTASPVVTVMVAYKVGSGDEDLDHTGLSHYLEHLMFKGTKKLMPGDIDRLTLRNGGANNAYTSEDYTIFHFDFAADRWTVALGVEADRMLNLMIDTDHEFEQEKGAVIEELKRDEDQPWDLEQKTIVPLLFGKETPYGHPVIGEEKHVREATAKIIKAHYDKWYAPNNASLVICGGFDPEDALARVKKLFGPIPRKELPPRKKAPPVSRSKPVHKEFESKFDVARMLMGFNTVRIGEPDYYPLDVLQYILSEGKTSRLYKKLVEGEKIAGAIGSSNSAGRHPGWFSVQVELLVGKDRKQAEALTLAELKRLCDEPLSPAELKRVKRQLLASAIFRRESVHEQADSIARGVTTNDLEFLKTYLPKIQAVTAEEVQAAARKYFDPQKRVVVWSVPKDKKGAKGEIESGGRGWSASASPGEASEANDNNGRFSAHGRGFRSRSSPGHPAKAVGAGGVKEFTFKDARRVVLDNGLVLLLFENHQAPVVVAQADVRHVRVLEPEAQSGVAVLMGRLLDEGTFQHTSSEIATMIEDVGGAMGFSPSGGSVKVLSQDRSLGLKLLFECLMRARFPQDAFEREQKRQLSEIEESKKQPESKVQELYRSLVYGKHPFGRPRLGSKETVAKLTRKDVLDLHRRLFVPNNTVVAIVGDFDTDKVIAEVKELTDNWKKGEVPKVETPKVTKPTEFVQKIVTMPEAAQLHFLMGEPGIKRDNPDYYKLLVMDYVLGTGPGFTDRLSAKLRDRQGLAYTVSANITSSAGEEPGTFTCYIGTDPKNFALVKKLFLEELNRIRNEPPKAEEVDGAKQYLIGNLPFSFTTNGAIAGQLLEVERNKLGFNYLDDYRKAVASVTPEQVQAVAKKYLDPAHMVLVAVGAVDQSGKVVAPPP